MPYGHIAVHIGIASHIGVAAYIGVPLYVSVAGDNCCVHCRSDFEISSMVVDNWSPTLANAREAAR